MSIGPGIHRHQHLPGVMVRRASSVFFHYGDSSGYGGMAGPEGGSGEDEMILTKRLLSRTSEALRVIEAAII